MLRALETLASGLATQAAGKPRAEPSALQCACGPGHPLSRYRPLICARAFCVWAGQCPVRRGRGRRAQGIVCRFPSADATRDFPSGR